MAIDVPVSDATVSLKDTGEAQRASGVPTLVLWGERDEFLSAKAVGQPLAKSGPFPAI